MFTNSGKIIGIEKYKITSRAEMSTTPAPSPKAPKEPNVNMKSEYKVMNIWAKRAIFKLFPLNLKRPYTTKRIGKIENIFPKKDGKISMTNGI